MKKQNKNPHHLRCEALICANDLNPDYKKEVLWYPGERVCKNTPYEKFQKIQIEINYLVKKGKFKNLGRGYTADELENLSI